MPLAELLPVPEVVVPDVLDVPDVPDVLEVLAVLDAVLLLVPDVAGVVVELDVPLPYAPAVPELGLPEAAPQPARMAAAATNPIPSTQRCITLPIAQHSLSERPWRVARPRTPYPAKMKKLWMIERCISIAFRGISLVLSYMGY